MTLHEFRTQHLHSKNIRRIRHNNHVKRGVQVVSEFIFYLLNRSTYVYVIPDMPSGIIVPLKVVNFFFLSHSFGVKYFPTHLMARKM